MEGRGSLGKSGVLGAWFMFSLAHCKPNKHFTCKLRAETMGPDCLGLKLGSASSWLGDSKHVV